MEVRRGSQRLTSNRATRVADRRETQQLSRLRVENRSNLLRFVLRQAALSRIDGGLRQTTTPPLLY